MNLYRSLLQKPGKSFFGTQFKRYLNTSINMTTTEAVPVPTTPLVQEKGPDAMAAAASADVTTEVKEEKKKLSGRELYEKLGRPTKIVAPMVDASEFGWRMISRKYGAELCYSPMFHARLFATDPNYRRKMFGPLDGNPEMDRPLIVQFCANDPEYLLQAAKFVEDRCDAVDLNLGCPQGIARKGHYGSFLMEDWDLVHSLIRKLHDNLKIPVTAKIRVFDDWEKSLNYAKMVLDAGAQFITIHGRTREMKGQKTGMANWDLVQYIRENLPEGSVFFSNGNILYPDDVDRCIERIKCDAVMSAEGNLCNPGVFWTQSDDIEMQYPRIDVFVRELFEIVKQDPGEASKHCFKTHLFKCMKNFLPIHTEIRSELGKVSRHATWEEVEDKVIKPIEDVVAKIYEQENIKELDQIKAGPVEQWGGSYKEVPYWRLQPHFRNVDGVSGKEVAAKSFQKINEINETQTGADVNDDGEVEKGKKRKAEEDIDRESKK